MSLPPAVVTFDQGTGVVTVVYPETAELPTTQDWILKYTFPVMTTFNQNTGRIPLEDMEGWTGNEILTDELYDLATPDDLKINMWAKYVSDSDFK
jgi:hypothetical protein